MKFVEINKSQIPPKVKAYQENLAIYEAARKLLRSGVGRAMKVELDNVSLKHVRQKAYVYFRRKTHKLRTKTVDGNLYMWIEDREPKRFEPVSIPVNKTVRRA